MAEKIRCTVLNSDLTTREPLRREPPIARRKWRVGVSEMSSTILPTSASSVSLLSNLPHSRDGATPHPGTGKASICRISTIGNGDLAGSAAPSLGAASAVFSSMLASGSQPLRFRPHVRFFLASLFPSFFARFVCASTRFTKLITLALLNATDLVERRGLASSSASSRDCIRSCLRAP
jgi:hypothetical protein